MDLLVKQTWTVDRSAAAASGVMASAIEVPLGMAYASIYLDCSTLTSTQSFNFESAQESTGPWFIEKSTAIAVNTSTRFLMNVVGPVGPWVRARLLSASSGTYHVLFLGVG